MIGFPVLAVAASLAGAGIEYDCTAEKRVLLMSDESDWSYSADKVTREEQETFRWTFVTSRSEDGSLLVSHDPGILDALGLGGQYLATEIAPRQFAFATRKDSNCLFTEEACGALVQISDFSEKKASFSIVPMGSVLKENGDRENFQMVMLGTCKKSKVAQ
ncbi:hypothetical protein HKD42_05475 [Altererythrobacter sp. RZ02]|uniref:Uncharacterized protein n=1 Tax=Pontixanthobacter rizhaonensis TaxID=2730337 RepID=A0A848QLE9_9SPHN|nr:hypothetical protein [Pontixanthobacter rizhaonensis]NMW31503.1 hypothetical protein [Pontixanthobacter rizhaonensis]